MTTLREALEEVADNWRRAPEENWLHSAIRDTYASCEHEVRQLLAAHPVEPTAVEQVVTDFIVQREEYVQALRNSVDAGPDYHRWQGHAEARRQLRDRLGAPIVFSTDRAAHGGTS